MNDDVALLAVMFVALQVTLMCILGCILLATIPSLIGVMP